MDEGGDDAHAARTQGMAERDGAAVGIHPLRIELEVSNAGDDLGGERLVQLDEVHVARPQSGAGQCLTRCRNGPQAHAGWIDAGAGGGQDPGDRPGIEPLGARFGHHHEARRPIVERRRVARRHRPILFESRLQGGQLLQARVRPRPFVLVERRARRQCDRHQLGAEMTRLLRADRLLMAFQRPSVLRLPGDAVAAGHHLGRLAQADGRIFLREPRIHHAPAQGAIVQRLAAARELTLRLFEDVRGARHALNPTREEAIAVAGLDLARGRDHRLHTRATQPVHRGGRDLNRQPGEQDCHARHVPVVFSRLVGIAEIDVLDAGGIQRVALDGLPDDERGEIVRPDVFERPTVASDRGAQRIDDDRRLHRGHATSLKCCRTRERSRPAIRRGQSGGRSAAWLHQDHQTDSR